MGWVFWRTYFPHHFMVNLFLNFQIGSNGGTFREDGRIVRFAWGWINAGLLRLQAEIATASFMSLYHIFYSFITCSERCKVGM